MLGDGHQQSVTEATAHGGRGGRGGRGGQSGPGLKAGKGKGKGAKGRGHTSNDVPEPPRLQDPTKAATAPPEKSPHLWVDPDEEARRERRAQRFGTSGRGGRGGRSGAMVASAATAAEPGVADRDGISSRAVARTLDASEAAKNPYEEPVATSPGRWLDPTRPAPPDLPALLQRLYEGLVPPVDLSSRDEAVRARMERCLRGRWPDVSVGIYGSAGSGLRVGASSDVDMCAFFPQHYRWGEKVHALLRGAEAALLEVEAAEPEVAAQLAQLDAAERALRQLNSGMRERGEKQARLSASVARAPPAQGEGPAGAEAEEEAEAETAEAAEAAETEAELGEEAGGEPAPSRAGAGAGGGAARGRRAAPRRGLSTMEQMVASLAEVEARLEGDGKQRARLEDEARRARAALAEAAHGCAAVRAARAAVEEARKQARGCPRPVQPAPAPCRRTPTARGLPRPHASPSTSRCLALPRLASP